jgi:hypothetical protein
MITGVTTGTGLNYLANCALLDWSPHDIIMADFKCLVAIIERNMEACSRKDKGFYICIYVTDSISVYMDFWKIH